MSWVFALAALAFGIGHIKRGHRADFHLLLVVAQKPLGVRDSRLRDVHVTPCINNLPIVVFYCGDVSEHGKLKRIIRNHFAVLRDQDEAIIYFAAEPTQKILGHADTQGGLHVRIKCRAVGFAESFVLSW